jgi:antitoxin (DNA-binding transcriptional repressor) of toxin-antitoxin stability system
MQQVNIHEAKMDLSRLIDEATRGEPFIIAKSGSPMVIVKAYAPTPDPVRRVGFLKGAIEVPDDFDNMGREEIKDAFAGSA